MVDAPQLPPGDDEDEDEDDPQQNNEARQPTHGDTLDRNTKHVEPLVGAKQDHPHPHDHDHDP